MADHHPAGFFQNVMHGKPILAGGFHAHILAALRRKPVPKVAQTAGKGGEAFAAVGCDALGIRGRDACNHEIPVHIHTAADGMNDFEFCHIGTSKSILEETGSDWTLS